MTETEIPFPPLLISSSSCHFFSGHQFPPLPCLPKSWNKRAVLLHAANILTPFGHTFFPLFSSLLSFINTALLQASNLCPLNSPSLPSSALPPSHPSSGTQSSLGVACLTQAHFYLAPYPLGQLQGFSVMAHRQLKATSSFAVRASSPPAISPRDFLSLSSLPVPIQPLLSHLPAPPAAVPHQEGA